MLFSNADTTSRAAPATLVCAGVSHQTAPIELRERLALDSRGVSTLLQRFESCGGEGQVCRDELVVLSTCNRFELYASGPRVRGAGVAELLQESTGVKGEELHIFVVSRTRENARRLGERYGARHIPFDQLPEAIAATDIILTSTAAPHHVITCDMVAARRLFGLQR
jgi:glutamyl-tRNA reductase